MKRLMFALLVAAASAVSFAQEAAPDAAAKTPVKAAEARVSPRPKFNREQFEARRKEMRAKRLEKIAEVLRNAGMDEAKAKTVAEEIEKVYMMRGHRPMRPQSRKPAGEQK